MTSTPSPNPLRKALEDAAETFEVLAEGGKPLRSWKLCAERCRSALAADDAAGGWRDISTAPKDEVFWAANYLFERLVYWVGDELHDLIDRRPIKGWFVPTHWQPIPALPPAPASEKEPPK